MRGPRRLLPYAAGSGRPVFAFSPLLLPGFLFLLRSKPSIVPRALTGIAIAFPQLHSVFCVSTCFFLTMGHRLRVLGNTYLNFISIGHIIASETEEDIFRALGMSHHYICIFPVICED